VDVYATGQGVIVYSGDLSTYGKLVMIDHGDGLKSVILGRYKVNVKKGDLVRKGDVIGMTSPGLEKNSEIYFEIRKGSKTLKTSSMIEKI
jgi:murein DD-endopeptidase MepM/ murein hydrolase activator NlpD